MVLECIVICVDNSDFMRNEDYPPNRLRAQVEALQIVIHAKLRSNPENYVSLVTLTNNRVVAHLNHSESKLLTDLSQVEIGGSIRLLPSLNVAQLVLKHKPIKHGKCRIIAFVGSPIDISENDLVLMGKKFKKENVSVDIVAFGNEKGNEILKVLVDTLNGPNGSSNSFTVIPQNVNMADNIVSSGLLAVQSEFGGSVGDDDEDEELRRAIEWSMLESGPQPPSTPVSTATPTGMQDGNELSDDEQLRLAIQLSLQEAERAGVTPEVTSTADSRMAPAPDPPKSADSAPGRQTTSPTNASESNNANSSSRNPQNSATNNKDKSTPDSSTTNPNNNNNNNKNNDAALAGTSDGTKTAADSKDAKKTVLNKKR